MADIKKLEVTLNKSGLKDSYFPKLFDPFNLKRGQKVQYDDHRNELLVKVPHEKQVRRIKMSKADVEKFTKYTF